MTLAAESRLGDLQEGREALQEEAFELTARKELQETNTKPSNNQNRHA